jgi:hypothetical protein
MPLDRREVGTPALDALSGVEHAEVLAKLLSSGWSSLICDAYARGPWAVVVRKFAGRSYIGRSICVSLTLG